MDRRLQRLLLIAALAVTATTWTAPLCAEEGTTADDEWLEDIDLIPEGERREVKLNEIDNENFEIGAQVGLMSVEDFGVNRVLTASAAYHVTEDLFVQATYGMTTVGETSFEVRSGGAQRLSDDERDMTFYDLSVGFNIFPGEAFLLQARSTSRAIPHRLRKVDRCADPAPAAPRSRTSMVRREPSASRKTTPQTRSRAKRRPSTLTPKRISAPTTSSK